ncbi:MAG TPA: Ig-like domain-containing protein, partial [Reyranella sp.]|nr:Ig-like domain-containing protein [Reyranella sp.]
NVGPDVDLRYVTLSNFTIEGNGLEGAGIRIVADGNDRWMYCWTLENVTVQHVGGFGLDVQGSVFEGIVSNSWMIGNAEGGASFAHSDGGGQVSALRWFGGGFEDNGGSGLLLDKGARDISVDGVAFANNAGPGISAEAGITSVSDSAFQDNGGVGVWFQNFGNFNDNTFSSSGAQAVGISGYLAGGVTLVGNSSTWTGGGADTTTLASLQGTGTAFLVDDSGKVVTGQNVAVSGTGGGNLTHVTVSTDGVDLAALEPVAAVTTAAVANSSGTSALETALKAALGGGTIVHLTDTSYIVTSSIVINITTSFQGPLGIDLGGAKILSQITDGGPVIQINIAAGVDIGTLSLSNFSIQGNGLEGDGLKIVVDGADRWIRDLDIRNVNVEHVGGIGLDVLGNVQGSIFDSWMHGNGQGGARIANSAGGGVADHLDWVGGGFRKNDVAGLILDNGAYDLTIQGAYFVDNYGPGIQATAGITQVLQSGFENNLGTGAIVGGAATFTDVSFSTYGVQTVGIGGYLTADQVSLLGVGSEYYGTGANPTVLANLQGTGVLAIAGTGNVVVGPGIALAGGTPFVAPPQDTTAPVVSSITTSGAGILAGAGILNAGDVVLLTVTLSEAVTVGGTPALVLNDGGTATYVGGSGSTSLAFSYTVAAGQNTADLAVTAVNLNGATISDAAGNAADLSAAANNPTGVLRIDTTAPAVSLIAASGPGITNGGGTIGAGKTVTLTVNTSEAVTVTGTPSLTLNDGGTATYVAGSGTSALTFSYTAAAGQNTADLSILGLSLNGGTIIDLAGNAANLSGATAYNPAGVLAVDTTAPSVLSLAASGTGIVAGSGSLNAGRTITLTVNMSEAVSVTGVPTLTLNDGGTATYTGGSGTSTLTFSHTVAAGQNTSDLTVLGLNLNGGAIRDAAGNAADLANATGYSPAGTLAIDTTAPTVASIAASGPGIVAGSGTLTVGKTVILTVALSEAVTVNGVPTLTLNDGGVATYAGGSGSAALSFSYTVAAGENTPDLAVASFNLNGATLRDAAGNAANLGGAAGYNPAGTLKIDTAAAPPTVTQRLANDTGASLSDRVSASTALVGTADANAVVHFTVDGSSIAATATADANGVWAFMPTGLADGGHTIVASQTNAAGATGTASLSFTLDTTAPTPVFAGAVLADGQVTLSGRTGSAGDTLSIYDGYSWLGFATTGSDGRFTFTAAADPNAVHSYGANATDLAGNLGRTAAPYVVDPSPPPMVTAGLSNDTGASSADLITSDPTLRGTAVAGAVVHFTVDGSPIAATATADASGVWSFTAGGLADGAHTIVASETNAGGATGTASVAFLLDTTAPQPVIDGAVQANGQVTLTGSTGGAGDTLSIYDGYTWLGFAVTDSDGHFSFAAAAAANAVHTYGANASDLAGHGGRTEGVFQLGSASADALAGSAAGDVVQGGGGADTLTGGVGADRFVYRAADSTAAAADTITDFQHGVDQIDFGGIAGLAAPNGTVEFQGQLAGTGDLKLNPHSVAFLETGGNTLVLANTTDVAELVKATDTHAADVTIVLLGTNLGLTGSDFDLF